jgi:hypothetical protein
MQQPEHIRVERASRSMAALDFPTTLRQSLTSELAAVLAAGVEDMHDCVVLKSFHESAARTSVASCQDETGFEAFINHIHVEDYLPRDTPQSTVREQASEFVRQLADKLVAAHPERDFHIIVAISDSCTVRFHTDRPGQSWLSDDIEGYLDEAVMSLTTAPK